MPSAAEFKEQAAIAWANGQFDEAIEQYTSALFKVADGSDKDLQKTLLSNRSAAYMKVGRTQAALTDAIKCVEIDETWAKGHSRKGDALYALGKLTEAYNAYNAGLMHSKDDASLKEKAEMTMHAIRNVATAAEGTANAGVATNPSAGGLLQSVQGVLKFLVIANGIVFALPFLNRVAPMNYKIFVIGAFTDFAIALYSTHGKPQFNMGYVQRVLPDPTLMYILMCIILFIGTPYFTSMIPILLLETAQFAYFVAQRGADRHGAVLERAGALVDKTVPRALGIVGWEHMTTSTKWSQFNVKVFFFLMLNRLFCRVYGFVCSGGRDVLHVRGDAGTHDDFPTIISDQKCSFYSYVVAVSTNEV